MTAEQIIQAVSEVTGVPVPRLYTKGRDRDKVEARQMAAFIMYNYGAMTKQAIADHFNFNHTTILYSIEQMGGLLDSDTRLRRISVEILRKIGIETLECFTVKGSTYDTQVTNGEEIVLNQDGSIISLTRESLRNIYLSTVAQPLSA